MTTTENKIEAAVASCAEDSRVMAEQHPTKGEAFQAFIGDVSEEFMDRMLQACAIVFKEQMKLYHSEGDAPPAAAQFAAFDCFWQGMQLGKKLGYNEGVEIGGGF